MAQQFEEWRLAEVDAIRQQEKETAAREADVLLQAWKITHETYFRQDAIARSQAVIVGKVSEHLIPYMQVFPYNPKDARFIGSPVDIIVFDGCNENALRDIVFLEVKTGSSSMSTRQRQIRDAVIAKRVSWRELRI
jgi:predicted Holliday junction resolvase-like endonuclease